MRYSCAAIHITFILTCSALSCLISVGEAAFNSEQLITDWPYFLGELQKGFFLGVFIGLLSFVLSNLDIWFSVVVLLSTALATIISRLCKLCFAWMLRKLMNTCHIQRFSWIEVPIMTGLQDCIRCLVYFNSLALLLVVA